MDSGHTSSVILAEVGIGVLIEGWKVVKYADRRGGILALFRFRAAARHAAATGERARAKP